jgi:hypothetical protein
VRVSVCRPPVRWLEPHAAMSLALSIQPRQLRPAKLRHCQLLALSQGSAPSPSLRMRCRHNPGAVVEMRGDLGEILCTCATVWNDQKCNTYEIPQVTEVYISTPKQTWSIGELGPRTDTTVSPPEVLPQICMLKTSHGEMHRASQNLRPVNSRPATSRALVQYPLLWLFCASSEVSLGITVSRTEKPNRVQETVMAASSHGIV